MATIYLKAEFFKAGAYVKDRLMKVIPASVAAFLFILALGMPVHAEQVGSGGGGSGASYTCNSEGQICRCHGYFDCQRMRDKVCAPFDDGTLISCKAGTADCTCKWKQKNLDRDSRPSATAPSTMAPTDPVARDQRTRPLVRDHRQPTVRDQQKTR